MVVAIWILSILLTLAIATIVGVFVSWQRESDEWSDRRSELRKEASRWQLRAQREMEHAAALEQAESVRTMQEDIRPNPSAQYRVFAELAFRLHPDLEEAFGYPKKTTDKATGKTTVHIYSESHPLIDFDKVENFLRLEKDAAEYTKFKEILNG